MGRDYLVLNYRSVIKVQKILSFAEGVDTMATLVEILSLAVTAGSGINTCTARVEMLIKVLYYREIVCMVTEYAVALSIALDLAAVVSWV